MLSTWWFGPCDMVSKISRTSRELFQWCFAPISYGLFWSWFHRLLSQKFWLLEFNFCGLETKLFFVPFGDLTECGLKIGLEFDLFKAENSCLMNFSALISLHLLRCINFGDEFSIWWRWHRRLQTWMKLPNTYFRILFYKNGFSKKSKILFSIIIYHFR